MSELNVSQYPFTVKAPNAEDANSFTATVVVEATPDTMSGVLHYIRSIQLKNDFTNGCLKKNAPGYGISLSGGPRHVFETPGDRSTPVVAYEQDFRLSRPI